MKRVILPSALAIIGAMIFLPGAYAGGTCVGGCYPGYSYRSYSYYPSYGYSYSYYPNSWYGGRFYPAGYYYYTNGIWYRQGYGAYYGLTYSTAAVEIPAPSVLEIEIPNPVILSSVPTVIQPTKPAIVPAPIPAPSSAAPSTTASASVSLSSGDVQAFVSTAKALTETIKKMDSQVSTLTRRVEAIEKFLSEPPPPVKERPKAEAPPRPKEEKK